MWRLRCNCSVGACRLVVRQPRISLLEQRPERNTESVGLQQHMGAAASPLHLPALGEVLDVNGEAIPGQCGGLNPGHRWRGRVFVSARTGLQPSRRHQHKRIQRLQHNRAKRLRRVVGTGLALTGSSVIVYLGRTFNWPFTGRCLDEPVTIPRLCRYCPTWVLSDPPDPATFALRCPDATYEFWVCLDPPYAEPRL